MLSKFHKHLKKMSLSLLGGAAALALGLLLLVPEAQSGETYYECALRPQKQKVASDRKKMNHSNHTVVKKNYYNIQRRTYGPTDVMGKRERTLGDLTTNTVIRISDDGTTQRFLRITHKSKKETPSGVNRVGRKGKREKARKDALEKAQKDARGFQTDSKKTNDFSALRFQKATPPTSAVQTASAPKASHDPARSKKSLSERHTRMNATLLKERKRETAEELGAPIQTPRASYEDAQDADTSL
ncbi:hypothetical protein J6X96_06485 [bacterium]|nr:hypothetical protein [bacterium]